MSPFNPIGDRARWRILYEDILVHKPVNGIITYAEMAEALGLHPDDDRQSIQMAMRRAARELEEVDKHAVDPVPNKGYRIVEAVEHMQLARRQQRRSRTALRSGRSKVVNVDMSGMDPDVRKGFELMAVGFAMQMDLNRRFNVRQDKFEQVLTATVEQHSRSADEIAELRARLDRLERGETQT